MFDPADASARNSFYSNNYTPHFMCDGDKAPGSSVGAYESYVTARMADPSPLQLDLYRRYDPSGKGKIYARVVNETADPINAKIYNVLTETGIAYAAPNGLGTHNGVMRDMFPFSFGRTADFAAHETLEFIESFELPLATVVPESCAIVTFVQSPNSSGSQKEIYQGAHIWAMTDKVLVYAGNTVKDPSGNNDGKLDAGETADLVVSLKNTGSGSCTGILGHLTCTDPAITILKGTASFGTIAKGATGTNDADRFRVQVSSGAANNHPVTFALLATTAERAFMDSSFVDTTHAPIGPVAEPPTTAPTAPGLLNVQMRAGGQVVLSTLFDHARCAELVIVDAQGRVVECLARGTVPAGARRWSWTAPAAGVYFAVLTDLDSRRLARTKLTLLR